MDEGINELLVAVCKQALSDYYRWGKYLRGHIKQPNEMSRFTHATNVEFILSDEFRLIMNIDGRDVIRMLDEKLDKRESLYSKEVKDECIHEQIQTDEQA